MNHRFAAAWAAAFGASGVILGSVGAHPIRATLEAAGMLGAWQTANSFQLLHAAALLGFAGWLRASPNPAAASAAWAVRLWILGTVLFSGSLYMLALGGPRWIGPATPVGGVALIAAWVLAAVAALAA
jgi:uncharacterized membrane protein YgdD (TMEM256/DUF423 family)